MFQTNRARPLLHANAPNLIVATGVFESNMLSTLSRPEAHVLN